ncbi:MerR family transcriptional regulator [Spirillospora albida]|uniref:helix-turn-helix domain-containing protein n=1 Tax=Spirillospora albida TaxID=58123 RepID=UPI000A0625D8|nr:MerR family transcriptional regulator [Spirillospora albida]
MDDAWTISELAERAAAALTSGASVRVNGRVRDLPNERLIRWYTTIGLLDPPLGRRGRAALYGRRHLLQLVAVKRRQSAGHSIAEIQLELAAATDQTLERIALPSPGRQAPEPAPGPSPKSDHHADATDLSAEPHGPTRGRFWSTRPDISFRGITATDDLVLPPAVVQGVKLAPDVTLLLEAAALTGDDVAALRHAARPLLRELHRRGLLTSSGHAPAEPDALSATSDATATSDPTVTSADPPGRPQ